MVISRLWYLYEQNCNRVILWTNRRISNVINVRPDNKKDYKGNEDKIFVNFYFFGIYDILNEPFLEECHLIWLPNHCGFSLNEKADTHAHEAPFDFYLLNDALRLIRKNIIQEWKDEYHENNSSKKLSSFL